MSFPLDSPEREAFDLSALALEWRLTIDGRSIPGSVTLTRRRTGYPPPYWWSS